MPAGYVFGLAAVALGAALRLYQITRQIVADDEWHAIQAAAYQSYGHIASHFGEADYSIPLALFYKVALDTIGLSEMVMRAPVLLAGLVSLIVFPALAASLVGRAAAGPFALLLALSPLHVYVSRYARPYAVSVLLTFLAGVAFYHWWSGGHRAWSHIYAVAGCLAAYFHLAALPAALAPFAFVLGAWAHSSSPRSQRELARLALEFVLLGASLLAVPLWVDHSTLTARMRASSAVDTYTVLGTWQLMAGTRHIWALLPLLAAFIYGGHRIARTQPRLVAYALTLVLTQVVAVLVAQPLSVQVPIVMARYLSPVVPWLLLFTAAGITFSVALLERRHALLSPALVGSIAAALWASGPLPTIYYRPNNWTNHAYFQYAYDGTNPHTVNYRREPASVNGFYRRLASEHPASLTLLEAPWYLDWASNVFPSYQRVHRQWMMVGFVRQHEDDVLQPLFNELHPTRARDFRNFVHVGQHAEIAARGIDYVIFHKDVETELPNRLERPHASVAARIDEYREVYGPPVYRDTAIVVFDVKKQR